MHMHVCAKGFCFSRPHALDVPRSHSLLFFLFLTVSLTFHFPVACSGADLCRSQLVGGQQLFLQETEILCVEKMGLSLAVLLPIIFICVCVYVSLLADYQSSLCCVVRQINNPDNRLLAKKILPCIKNNYLTNHKIISQ